MTTPDWPHRLDRLRAIGEGRPLPPQPPPRPPGSIALTSADLSRLLGPNANPFCGAGVWWFAPGEWPFGGKPGLWRDAVRMAKCSSGEVVGWTGKCICEAS